MRVWKLISGILSIVFFFILLIESFVVGFLEVYEETGTFSGFAGVICAVFMLIAGIVSVAAHNGGRGSSIVIAILFAFAALFAFIGAVMFPDMFIWAIWSIVCVILAIISAIVPGTNKGSYA